MYSVRLVPYYLDQQVPKIAGQGVGGWGLGHDEDQNGAHLSSGRERVVLSSVSRYRLPRYFFWPVKDG